VLFDGKPHPLRAVAICLATTKILAYNRNLERHHLRLRTAIASWLFLRGTPLDRIFLRPSWLYPWKKDRTRVPDDAHIVDGRPLDPSRRRVAIVSPYFPYPLSHGGAVRIYNLLKEAAAEFDLFLFAFAKDPAAQEYGPVMEFCAKAVVLSPPYYREPRWSTLDPPEVREFDSEPMRRMLARFRAEFKIELTQVEYTQMAPYGGDVLVEHDVTQDLYHQVYEREPCLRRWWDYVRWKRFESQAVRRFRRVVAMSEKDAQLLGGATVIENGVDLDRFRPEPEQPGRRLLFVGSFNHFPNVEAFRFFRDEVWPQIAGRFPDMTLTVVAGRDHALYWRQFTGEMEMPSTGRIHVLDFVRDVRPLYVDCNLVIVPTTVSAGTNLKVLEAMAMERVVVSTSCGCAGLGLEHDRSIYIADDASAFAEGSSEATRRAGRSTASSAGSPHDCRTKIRLETTRRKAEGAVGRATPPNFLVMITTYGTDELDGRVYQKCPRATLHSSKNCRARTHRERLSKRRERTSAKPSQWFWMRTASCPRSLWKAPRSFGKP